MIAGPTGSGKTILALTIASSIAKTGKKVLYVTFEESLGAIRETLEKLGLYEDISVVALIPEARTPVQYYATIRTLIEEKGAEVLVIDSLSAMQSHMDDRDFVKALRYLQLLTKERNITFIVTYTARSPDGLVSTGFSTLVDGIIILGYSLPSKAGDSMKRHLLVLKSRHSEHKPTLREFHIGAGGIIIE